MGAAHRLALSPLKPGTQISGYLVALRRELCARDRIKLALSACLSWMPSRSPAVICCVNEPQRKSPSEFHYDSCPHC